MSMKKIAKKSENTEPEASGASLPTISLTQRDCEQILDSVLGPSVRGYLVSYCLSRGIGEVGYLGEYYNLRLTYVLELDPQANQKIQNLFIKTIEFNNEDWNMFVQRQRILKKEAKIYSKLLMELVEQCQPQWCTRFFFEKDNVIILKNIFELDYRHPKTRVFLSADEMRSLLKGLAVMHACSILYEIRNKITIGEKFADCLYEIRIAPEITFWSVGLRAVIAVALQHPLYQSPEHQEFIRNRLENRVSCVYTMMQPSAKYRNVFCHRDPWGANAFFSKTNPQEAAMFVDFQTARYLPPAIDVLFALHLNIRPRHRKVIMSSYLQWYHECFTVELHQAKVDSDSIMTFKQFKESCEDFKVSAALYNCITSTLIHLPDNGLLEMRLNRPHEFNRYANVDRTDKILNYLNSNYFFKELMFDIIKDLMDIVLPLSLMV